MPIRRSLAAVAAVLAILVLPGCATPWDDRFYVPGRDPVLTMMGAEWEGNRDWPPASLPYLPPMRTELIPDRRAPAGEPPIGWPPL